LQFIDNGDIITNPNHIANRFNYYFINVSPTLSRKTDETAKALKEYLGNSYIDSLFLEPITIVEVEQELKILNPNNSSGIDNIKPRVIRETSSLISCPLAHTFNQSITRTGIIPSRMKISVISPIYK